MWKQELIKALFTCLSGAVVLALGWFVGQRLTYQWNVRQKRKEQQLAALQAFYTAYGEFFAVWKLWNRLDHEAADYEAKRWELLKRATAAEGNVEGIMVKLSSECELDQAELQKLGCFRQAFQLLRQSIRQGRMLEWGSSESPQYHAFKRLAAHLAHLLSREWKEQRLSAEGATEQLYEITSNVWETKWDQPCL